MRPRTTTATAVLVALALSAALASQALALPELLGQAAGAEYTTRNTAENPTWETTKEEKIVCKEFTGEGLQETDTLGTFHWHLTGCKASGFSCNTAGDSSGVDLWLGTFHYVFDHLGSGAELGVAILFLPEEISEKCTALVTLKFKGTFVCLVAEPLSSSATHNFTCSETKGVPSDTTWWNDEGVEQHAKFESSKNGGSFIETGISMQASFTFGTAVAFMNE